MKERTPESEGRHARCGAGPAALLVLLSACTGTITDGTGNPTATLPGVGADGTTVPLDPASVPLISDQDPAANIPLSDITCTADKYAAARTLRLSAAQYANTIQAAFGYDRLSIEQFPRDGINDATGFNNDARTNFVGDQLAQLYFQSGVKIAQSVVAELPTTQPCVLNGADTRVPGRVHSWLRRARIFAPSVCRGSQPLHRVVPA